MRALTVIPLKAGSAAVTDMPEPEPGPGELLVEGIALGVVRRPDPEPCPACARGEFDFCRNGRCTDVKVVLDL